MIVEHEERSEEMESTADALEEQTKRVSERIEESRADWESKKQDSSVPGAQPPEDELDERDEDAEPA
jgi:hypothetical protein